MSWHLAPKQQEKAVSEVVKETESRLRKEFDYQKQLQQKEFEGERNVLTARIAALEETVREQADRVAKLSGQQELSYQKVQEIAVNLRNRISSILRLESITERTRTSLPDIR